MRLLVFVVKVFAILGLFFVNVPQIFTQSVSIYHLPAGTRMKLKMDTEINSKVSSVNDTFIARVSEPVRNRDSVVLPIGTIIEGRVVEVTRASAGSRNGRLGIRFETIRFENSIERAIVGELAVPLSVDSGKKAGTLMILGGTAFGAVIGAITGGGGNALLGAGIGAGAGTGIALLRRGKQVRIGTGEEFEIVLKREVVLPVNNI